MENSAQPTVHSGGCLCQAVRYVVSGPLRPIVACHCTQCQKTSGHHVAATATRTEHLTVDVSTGLTWYRSSNEAERGFCCICGGNLFYRRMGAEIVSIFAGTLDQPHNLRLAEHIYVSEKAAYYEIGDQLPQHETFTITVAIGDN